MVLDKDVVDLICCPNCAGDLVLDSEEYVCSNCSCSYREKDGVVVLISKDLEAELRS